MKKLYKLLAAILSGILLSITWPQHGFAPIIFIAFVPILFVEDEISKGKKGNVFWLSFITFLVWNVLTTWWVYNATSAAIAAFVLNALFMATVFWMFHYTKTKLCNNATGNFILIFFWMSFELLHYHWQADWPWLSLGNVFSNYNQWIQWYEYTGVPGGTLWILLINILIYNILSLFFNPFKKENKKKIYGSAFAALLLLFIPILCSNVRYNHYEEKGKDVEIIVVQQNCDPWSEQYTLSSKEITDRNINLAQPLVTPKTRFVVSSESAIQEGIWLNATENSKSIQYLRKFIKKNPQLAVVIGATTYEYVPEGMENDFAARKFGDADIYYYGHNTAFLIDTADLQHRNKTMLVPGVEQVPSWMKFLKNYSITMEVARGTLKGDPAARLLSFDNYKAATLICYESAFGGYLTEFVREGANLIFVITNDGWWGNTPGHRQHFEFSKLRAIETRRSVARSANTGISGFINQKGDVLQKTKYWEQDVIKETLKANDEMTFYAKHGDYLSRIAVYCMVILAILAVGKSIANKFSVLQRKKTK
jgi:apolipoprotein N-acyltransferase